MFVEHWLYVWSIFPERQCRRLRPNMHTRTHIHMYTPIHVRTIAILQVLVSRLHQNLCKSDTPANYTSVSANLRTTHIHTHTRRYGNVLSRIDDVR